MDFPSSYRRVAHEASYGASTDRAHTQRQQLYGDGPESFPPPPQRPPQPASTSSYADATPRGGYVVRAPAANSPMRPPHPLEDRDESAAPTGRFLTESQYPREVGRRTPPPQQQQQYNTSPSKPPTPPSSAQGSSSAAELHRMRQSYNPSMSTPTGSSNGVPPRPEHHPEQQPHHHGGGGGGDPPQQHSNQQRSPSSVEEAFLQRQHHVRMNTSPMMKTPVGGGEIPWRDMDNPRLTPPPVKHNQPGPPLPSQQQQQQLYTSGETSINPNTADHQQLQEFARRSFVQEGHHPSATSGGGTASGYGSPLPVQYNTPTKGGTNVLGYQQLVGAAEGQQYALPSAHEAALPPPRHQRHQVYPIPEQHHSPATPPPQAGFGTPPPAPPPPPPSAAATPAPQVSNTPTSSRGLTITKAPVAAPYNSSIVVPFSDSKLKHQQQQQQPRHPPGQPSGEEDEVPPPPPPEEAYPGEEYNNQHNQQQQPPNHAVFDESNIFTNYSNGGGGDGYNNGNNRFPGGGFIDTSPRVGTDGRGYFNNPLTQEMRRQRAEERTQQLLVSSDATTAYYRPDIVKKPPPLMSRFAGEVNNNANPSEQRQVADSFRTDGGYGRTGPADGKKVSSITHPRHFDELAAGAGWGEGGNRKGHKDEGLFPHDSQSPTFHDKRRPSSRSPPRQNPQRRGSPARKANVGSGATSPPALRPPEFHQHDEAGTTPKGAAPYQATPLGGHPYIPPESGISAAEDLAAGHVRSPVQKAILQKEAERAYREQGGGSAPKFYSTSSWPLVDDVMLVSSITCIIECIGDNRGLATEVPKNVYQANHQIYDPPDASGLYFATGHEQGAVNIYCISMALRRKAKWQLKLTKTFTHLHLNPITAVDVTNSILTTASMDGTVRRTDCSTGTIIATYTVVGLDPRDHQVPHPLDASTIAKTQSGMSHLGGNNMSPSALQQASAKSPVSATVIDLDQNLIAIGTSRGGIAIFVISQPTSPYFMVDGDSPVHRQLAMSAATGSSSSTGLGVGDLSLRLSGPVLAVQINAVNGNLLAADRQQIILTNFVAADALATPGTNNAAPQLAPQRILNVPQRSLQFVSFASPSEIFAATYDGWVYRCHRYVGGFSSQELIEQGAVNVRNSASLAQIVSYRVLPGELGDGGSLISTDVESLMRIWEWRTGPAAKYYGTFKEDPARDPIPTVEHATDIVLASGGAHGARSGSSLLHHGVVLFDKFCLVATDIQMEVYVCRDEL